MSFREAPPPYRFHPPLSFAYSHVITGAAHPAPQVQEHPSKCSSAPLSVSVGKNLPSSIFPFTLWAICPHAVHLSSRSLFWDVGSDLTVPKDPLGCSSLQVTLPPKKNPASTLKTSATGYFKETVLQLQSKHTRRL